MDQIHISDDTKLAESLREELLTIQGYQNYIGVKNGQKLSHVKENFISSCVFIAYQGLTPKYVSCDKQNDTQTITEYYDFQWFTCFQIKAPHPVDGMWIYGMSLVLHIRSAANKDITLLRHSYPFSEHIGGRFVKFRVSI